MYPIENIIRSTGDRKRLSVLVFNEAKDEYVVDLCKTNHDFYLCQEFCENRQWGEGPTPANLNYFKSRSQIPDRYFDAAITFNRATLFERAATMANTFHIPLIVVDFVSSHLKSAHPFLSKSTVESAQQLVGRNGYVNVCVNELVRESWMSVPQNLCVEINPIAKDYQVGNRTKILIDPLLPPDYIQNRLPFNVTKDNFTNNPKEATMYLHLWTNVNNLMLNCAASGIPILTMDSPDLKEFIHHKACVLIEDLTTITHPNFLMEILQFVNQNNTIDNAINLVKDYSEVNFVSKWNNVFSYISNVFYVRGI